MFKFIKSLCILIVMLAVMAFIGWQLLPNAIAKRGTKAMGVDVSIGNIPLSITPLTFENIIIDNPANFKALPHALTAKNIEVHFEPKNLIQDEIIIDQIIINDVYLGLEFTSKFFTDGNWLTISKNLTSTNKTDENKGADKVVVIKRLVIRNLRADLDIQNDNRPVHEFKQFKEIEFRNIRSDEGAPLGQIASSALGMMLMKVMGKEIFKDVLTIPQLNGFPVKEAEKGLEIFEKGWDSLLDFLKPGDGNE